MSVVSTLYFYVSIFQVFFSALLPLGVKRVNVFIELTCFAEVNVNYIGDSAKCSNSSVYTHTLCLR